MARGGETVHNSVRDVLDVVFRHKWKILFFFILTTTAVTAYTYITAEIYRSEAKLLLRLGRENLSVDPTVAGPTVGLLQNRESEVKSELAILTSRKLAEEVVDEVGPEAFLHRPDEDEPNAVMQDTPQAQLRPVRREVRAAERKAAGLLVRLDLAPALTPKMAAVRRFTESLSVDVEKNTNIITVALESQSSSLSRDALAILVRIYRERHIEIYSSQASPLFFEDQAKKLNKELTLREQTLDDYRRDSGISSLERQKEVLLDQSRELETLLDQSTAKVTAMDAEVTALKGSLGKTNQQVEVSKTTGYTNFAADYLKQSLTDLRKQETDLSARYEDTYRPLVELRQQIQQVQSALTQEDQTHTQVETGLNTNYQSIDLALKNKSAELQAEQARRDNLAETLATQQATLKNLSDRELEYTRLLREKDLAEAEYKAYRDNLQRSRISKALDMDNVSNVSIVQEPSYPLEPVRPKKLRNLALGVLAGIVGGVALAFAAQYADDTLKTDTEVRRRLKQPVLASVSDSEFRSCT